MHPKNILKKVIITSLFLLSLSSCTKKDAPQLGIDGQVYVAEQIPTGKRADGMTESPKIFQGELYYQISGGDSTQVYRTSAAEPNLAEGELVFQCPGILGDYVAGEEGEIYYFQGGAAGAWEASGAMSMRGSVMRLDAGDKTGSVLQADLRIPADSAGNCMVMTEDGELLILTDGAICRIDGAELPGTLISTEEYKAKEENYVRESLIRGADHRIYYCVTAGMYITVYELVEEDSWKLVRTAWGDRRAGQSVYASEYGILFDDGFSIYQEQKNGSGLQEVLRWQDSNLQNASWVVQPEEGKLIAGVYRITGYGEGVSEVWQLTRTSVEELPEKELLVMISKNPDHVLMERVMEFNRQIDHCHITIETYSEEQSAGIDARLVSGNPTDLLDMSDMDIMKYAEKGVLEDLAPYLDRSEVLDREAFLENVLEGYTIGGRLVCIPDHFYFSGVFGRQAQIGQGKGWNMEACFELTEKYPEARLFAYNDYDFILGDFCADYILEAFVDWRAGTCSFDSGEFRRLMTWIDENSGADSSWGLLPEDVLLCRGDIRMAANYCGYETIFGSEIALIGRPTVDGRPLFRASSNGEVGIVSGAGNKEEAWAFLEFLLTYDNSVYAYQSAGAFPTRRDMLTQLLEEEMTPLYATNENGEISLDENGEPVYQYEKLGSGIFFGVTVQYYVLSERQAQEILEAIEAADFHSRDKAGQEIINIILEESSVWRSGDKTLEEITALIQNRAETIVQESGG